MKHDLKGFGIATILLIVLIFSSCYSYSSRVDRLAKKNSEQVKQYNEYTHQIDSLQNVIDSLQKADEILFELIMTGDSIKKKENKNFH
jgi:hypothetical protein